MDSATVNRTDYSYTKGERFEAVRPQDSTILKGDGSFTRETSTLIDYQAKVGERYDAKRPQSSDLWKVKIKFICNIYALYLQNQDKMEGSTVNRSEYVHSKGERYETKRPTDSNLLKGDGLFTAETSTMKEFSPKQGERYGIKKHDNAEYWKVLISASPQKKYL